MSPDLRKFGKVPGIGVLINPLSGGNRKGLGSVRKAICEYARALQRDVQTPRGVCSALTEFARNGVNLVVVSGGDGTVQAVLTALFHHQPFEQHPLLMILQSGTTSMTAMDVGVLGKQNKALQRLFQWVRTGSGKATVVQRPILRLRVPGHEVQYGMFFGAAGICQGIQYYHRNLHAKNLRGKPGIGLTMIRFLWEAFRKNGGLVAPTPVRVALDQQPLKKQNLLVLIVSTLDRLLLGLRPFWGRGAGPLHYTAVESRPKHLLKGLPFLMQGRRIRGFSPENGYESRNVNEVRLYLDSTIALDGQMYTPESSKEPTLLQSGGNLNFLRL